MNKQEMKNSIQNAFPMAVFDGNELDVLIRLFEIKYYKKNEIILRQGEISRGLYILKTGSVDVNIKLPGTMPEKIKLIGKNLFFGEVSLIEGSITTATVQAEKATCFLFLSTGRFRALSVIYPDIVSKMLEAIREVILNRTYHNFKNIKKYKPEIYQILHKMNSQKTNMKKNDITIPFIRCIKLFNLFDDKELSFLLNQMSIIRLKKNSLLLGQETDSKYFIIQGCIRSLLINDRAGYQIKIMPPSGLIDFDLLNQFKKELIFQAKEDSLLFCLTQKTLNHIQINKPSFYYRFLKLSMLSLTDLFIASNHKLAQLKSGHIHLL